MGGFKGRLYRGLALRLCVGGCVCVGHALHECESTRPREAHNATPQAPPGAFATPPQYPITRPITRPLEGGIGITRPITLLLVTRSVRTKIEGRL